MKFLPQTWLRKENRRCFPKPRSHSVSPYNLFFNCFFSFVLNLFVWHWLIKLYSFQVYNSIIPHLYTVLCVHHPKSNLLSSPFVTPIFSSNSSHPSHSLVTTMQLSVSMRFLFAYSLHVFHPAPQIPLTAVSLFSVSLSQFLFCMLVYFVH